MLTPPSTLPKWRGLFLPDSGLSLGLLLLGAAGTGKTTYAALLGLHGLGKGYPQVIIDPTGTLSTTIIFLLLRYLRELPPEQRPACWQQLRKRLLFIDVGAQDSVVPFPIYYFRTGSESLREVSERFIETLRLAQPQLLQASVTFPRLRRVGLNAGMLLASLGFQLTEVEDLLFNTLAWMESGRFDEAIRRNPEAKAAVSYFRNHYLPLSRSAKAELISPFLDQVFTLSTDPKLMALFSASSPGLNWEDVLEKRHHTVILDCKNITDPESRRFALLWIVQNLVEHLKTRGRRELPLGVIIDEFADLSTPVTDGRNPLAALFDTLIQRYCRNHHIFLSVALQSLNQLDQTLRNTVLSLGTIVVGRLSTPEEARLLADVLFRTNPYFVKYNHRVWAHEPVINSYSGRTIGTNHFVIDHRPEFMPLDQQQELNAQAITNLGRFRFLCRPAVQEGEVAKDVIAISIDNLLRDEETNEYLFPDQELVEEVQQRLAKRSGMPASTIREEIASRLAQSTIQKPPQRTPQPSMLPEEAGFPPAPDKAKTDPTRPTLAEQERSFLAVISEHPDTPVSTLYKSLGVSVWKGNEIRQRLKAKGLLADVALRTGRPTAGRPATYTILTFQAFQLLGIEPPTGRGGVLHRHVQSLIRDGAAAKGYAAVEEKALGNGGIVDVHLEKGQHRIAVEVAIHSTPAREIAHFKHCLSFGYNHIYGIFAEEQLLSQTATLIKQTLSAEEAGKVRLLPLSQLPSIG
jgi:hypothetical protein